MTKSLMVALNSFGWVLNLKNLCRCRGLEIRDSGKVSLVDFCQLLRNLGKVVSLSNDGEKTESGITRDVAREGPK